MRRKQSNGQAGEQAFEAWARVHGWVMYRTQPAVRYLPGGKVVTVGTGGIADYTGYVDIRRAPIYRACEVKECKGSRMPASRLSVKQRAWLDSLPPGCAYVAIMWTDYGTMDVLEYKPSGSYVRGGV